MLDEDGINDPDTLPPTGEGYDDGFTTSTPSPHEHHALPDDWASVEALALVEADRVLDEHREGEREREEREREGAEPPPPRRRGIFQ